jgi:putative copper resistance protein D
MSDRILKAVVTLPDLATLAALIGASLCTVWISRRAFPYPEVFTDRLRRVFFICLTGLTLSSFAVLIQRALDMSGKGLDEVFHVLPPVIFKTHYGAMWIVRAAGLTIGWIIYIAGRRHIDSRLISGLIFCSGAAIAFSRSGSGHPADFGDLSPQQLSDWAHLLSASLWGGSLLAYAFVFKPSLVKQNNKLSQIATFTADRFYVLFGPVVSILLFTGLYNAIAQVGSCRELLTSPYGNILSVKIIIFAALILRYIAPPQHGDDEMAFALKFLRRTRVEAVMILIVLLCAALLTHSIPARHYKHLKDMPTDGGHEMHMQYSPAGPEPAVTLDTTPRITRDRAVTVRELRL